MRLLFLLGIVMLIDNAAYTAQTSSCNDESNGTYPAGPLLKQISVSQVTNGAARFSAKLIQTVAKNNRDNFVISPLGAALTLSMASFGARKRTETVFLTALGLPFHEYSRKVGLQSIVDQLNAFKDVRLYVANGAFVSSNIKPEAEFIEVTTRVFRSSVQHIDFSKPSEASNVINQWCKNKTLNWIKEIVTPDDFDESTGLALMNAVYFKGTWLNKFNPNQTAESTFFLEDGTTRKVLTMTSIHNVPFGEYPEVKAKFIQLPYQSSDTSNVSMFILLPDEMNGLAHLEENFHKISIPKLIQRGKHSYMNIQLPKFRIESGIQLKESLTRMNMGNLFDPDNADFTRIVESPRLYINKVVQKAVIDMDEEGTEAAAATGAIFGTRSSNGPKYLPFIVNRAFYALVATTGKHRVNIFTVRFTGSDGKTS